MIYELAEASEIINRSKKPEETQELLEVTLQAILHHQIIYSDTKGISNASFDLMKAEMGFFKKFFSTCGLNFNFNTKYEMFSITPKSEKIGQYASNTRNLSKEDTLYRLCLRYILEDKFQQGQIEEGRVRTTVSEITEVASTICKLNPLSETKTIEQILKPLHKKGAIRITNTVADNGSLEVLILQGIRILVPDALVSSLTNWSQEKNDSDFFEYSQETSNV